MMTGFQTNGVRVYTGARMARTVHFLADGSRTAERIFELLLHHSFDIKLNHLGAGTIAQSVLGSRFCTTPAHSGPAVQAILNELQ